MKKISAFIAILLLFGCVTAFAGYTIGERLTANVVDFSITLDGEDVEFDLPIVAIENRTYLPLRELCDMLGVEINWIEDERRIEMSTLDNELTLDDFAFLNLNMEAEHIFAVVGEPSSYAGFGTMWLVYYLSDGSELHLYGLMTGTLTDVVYQPVDGQGGSLEFNEDGTIILPDTPIEPVESIEPQDNDCPLG